jgi:hypothetical protein
MEYHKKIVGKPFRVSKGVFWEACKREFPKAANLVWVEENPFKEGWFAGQRWLNSIEVDGKTYAILDIQREKRGKYKLTYTIVLLAPLHS